MIIVNEGIVNEGIVNEGIQFLLNREIMLRVARVEQDLDEWRRISRRSDSVYPAGPINERMALINFPNDRRQIAARGPYPVSNINTWESNIEVSHSHVWAGGAPTPLIAGLGIIETRFRGAIRPVGARGAIDVVNFDVPVIPCLETNLGIPWGNNIAYEALKFTDWASSWPRGPFEPKLKLIKFASNIYRNLFINKEQRSAFFYLRFKLGDNKQYLFRIIEGSNPNSVVIQVRLSNTVLIRNTEILYIAQAIAKVFTEWREEYEPEDVSWIIVDRVTIVQPLENKFHTFSHVIHGALTARQFMEIGEVCREPMMRQDLKKFYKWLEDGNYQLTSPNTRKNCFAVALIAARKGLNLETASDQVLKSVTHAASAWMKKVRRTEDASYDVQVLCSRVNENSPPKNTVFWVINYRLEHIGVIQPVYGRRSTYTPKERYVIVFAGHMFAVIPKVPSPPAQESTVLGVIMPTFHKLTPTDIHVWDIETTADTVEPYMVAVAMCGDVLMWTGIGCIDQMLLHFAQNHFDNKLVFYAHNGGKFDSRFALKAVVESNTDRWRIVNITYHNGRIIDLTIICIAPESWPGRGNSISFRDSYPFMRDSLFNLSDMYEVEHPKIEGIKHKRVLATTWEREIRRQNIRDYLTHDVLALQEIMNKWRIQTRNRIEFDPIDAHCFTASSITRTIFLNGFYDPALYPLYNLHPDVDETIRETYHAGRVQVFKRGEFFASDAPLYYVDITSSYPYAMSAYEMPYGVPSFVDFSETEVGDFFGFMAVDVKGGNILMGAIRIMNDHLGLLSPVFDEWTTVWITSNAYYFIMERNNFFQYNLKPKYGWRFQHALFLREVALKLYSRKQNASSKTEREQSKLEANSLYGIFGQQLESDTIIAVRTDNELSPYFLSGTLHEVCGQIARVTVQMPSKCRNVAVASMVSDYAHLRLMDAIIDLIQQGTQPLYCDTDSILFQGTPSERWVDKWMGSELGQFKNEYPTPIKSALVVGAKIYALRFEDSKEVVKIKGCPSKWPYKRHPSDADTNVFSDYRPYRKKGFNIDYEAIRKVLLDIPLEVKTSRFYGGKRMLLLDDQSVKIKEATIHITGQYNKGHIGTHGFVHEWIFKNGELESPNVH